MTEQARRLVMYSRTTGCPFLTVARRVLDDYGVPYHELFIDRDPAARQRVLDWTGFLSVPTLVVAEQDSTLPYTDFQSLAKGQSPAGIDRGPLLTEATATQLIAWLRRHGFIVAEDADEERGRASGIAF